MIKKTLIYGILVGVLFAITPSIIFAEGGESPLCGQYDLVFVPPPYMGTVTLMFSTYSGGQCSGPDDLQSGVAKIYGKLERVGNSQDFIEFSGEIYEGGVTCQQFLTHTPKDIQGRCIFGPDIGKTEFGLYSIIAAHKLNYMGTTSFSVDIIVMQLGSKSK